MQVAFDHQREHPFPQFTVACFCVLGVEVAALTASLDIKYEEKVSSSGNSYICGQIHGHNVVITILPSSGTNNSAVVVRLRNDFPSVRIGLVVGVAGGVPDPYARNDIRLGDIVVGVPHGTTGGVIQFDRGKRHTAKRFEITGHSNKPPSELLTAVNKLRGDYERDPKHLQRSISNIFKLHPIMYERYSCPGWENDLLFFSNYEHQHLEDITCRRCDTTRLKERKPRPSSCPFVHHGIIGSSNSLIRDAIQRDELSLMHEILCVEMEAAGLVDELPCLVIKGVCDYADSHKNKQWQPYAAIAAAAYTRNLLGVFPHQKTSLPIQSDTYSKNVSAFENNPVTQTPIYRSTAEREESLKILIRSLAFRRMDARQRNISSALSKTCEWLPLHEQYRRWGDRSRLKDHHGFLWIKGKPGSGKSTIMRTILSRENKHKSEHIVVSYFFNARAPGTLEKSSLGLYRSLTHQILNAHPQIQTLFLERFFLKQDGELVEDWSINELQEFLIEVIQDHIKTPLVILIDALDEGDNADIRQLVIFLERLAHEASEADLDIRICLSSRYYPHISIKKGLHLHIDGEKGHADDIDLYVRESLVLFDTTSTDMDELRSRICQKAAGIFLWVVLVIRILRQAFDRGNCLDPKSLSQYLQEIPTELSALFQLQLTRYVDCEVGSNGHEREDCLTLLQWVLFARETLTTEQLYLAISVSSKSELYNGEHVPFQRLQRRLLDTSRGLIEIIQTNPPVVQLIHETVRDFLRICGLMLIDPYLNGNVAGLSHEKLKFSCYQYIENYDLSASEQSGLNSLDKDYFLRYASRHVFAHSSFAAEGGVPQEEFLQRQCLDHLTFLRSWIHIHDTFEGYESRCYNTNVSLLYIMVDQQLPNLLSILAKMVPDTPTQAMYSTACQAACRFGYTQDASYSDCLRIVQLLVAGGADVNALGGYFGTALQAASYEGHRDIVQLLVGNGANVNAQGGFYGNALQAASYRGHQKIAQLLLDTGADVNAWGGPFGNALQAAVKSGNTPFVRYLIDRGADVNAQGGDFGNALQAASYEGHRDIVLLLIDKGADVNAQGGRYGNALQAVSSQASSLEDAEIVQFLMDSGADPNAEGGFYGNALQAASFRGSQEVVQLLLDNRADVNALGGPYGNALQAASRGHSSPNESIVRLLIAWGADVNAQGGRYGNALNAALYETSDKARQVAQVLLEKGARPSRHALREIEGWTQKHEGPEPVLSLSGHAGYRHPVRRNRLFNSLVR